MTDTHAIRTRLDTELESLVLARRAAYRRVVAVLKARNQPFVVGGTFALSWWLDRFQDGDFEILVPPADAPGTLDALTTAGFKVERDEHEDRARVGFAEHSLALCWGLPQPLGGLLDDAWFTAGPRVRMLDLRVRLAPLEELLWVAIAAAGGASLADERIGQAMLTGRIDWNRFLARTTGLEALLLSHVFLLFHRYPEAARQALPEGLVEVLEDRVRWRMNAATSSSVQAP